MKPTDLNFSFYDPSWSESNFILFLFFYSIRVDPTQTGGQSYPVRLAKMFVCPVPKISQVMMKWCRRALHLCRFTLWNNGRRRASHLGRFTLWNNGRRATQLGRFTLWQNRRWASQLAGKFTLWHNGLRAEQPARSSTHFPKKNMKA